jgi:hypothetical protein
MKRQMFSGLAAILYLAIILMAGLVQHDHRDGRPFAHRDCQACQIELTFVADVPIVVVPILAGESVELPTPEVQSVSVVSSLFVSTASRAPPVAFA